MLSRKTKKIISLGLAAAISNSVALSAVTAQEMNLQNENNIVEESSYNNETFNDEIKNDEVENDEIEKDLNEDYDLNEEYNLDDYIESHVSTGPGVEVEKSEFEFDEDKQTITKYNGSEVTVTIPSRINGISVKSIEGNAFRDSKIVNVIIEDGIENIKSYAFNSCSMLKSVKIPKSVVNLDYYAFKNTRRLSKIEVDKENLCYKDVDGILYSKEGLELLKYPSNKSGSEFSVPEDVITIDSGAFDRCSNLEKIILTKNIMKIRDYAFNLSSDVKYYVPNMDVRNLLFNSDSSIGNDQIIVADGNDDSVNSGFIYHKGYDYNDEACIYIDGYNGKDKILKIPSVIENTPVKEAYIEPYDLDANETLETLIIPDTIEYISIYSMEKLKTIEVSEGNQFYKAIDGILFSKDESELTYYPSGRTEKEYIIPDGTKIIKDYAIEISDYLEKITIPSSVNEIEFNGIGYCYNLKNIKVDEGNAIYKDVDGILYSKNGSTLVKLPNLRSGENYVVPNNVKEIDQAAFAGCNNMVKVILHENINTIGDSAFLDCNKLQSINVNENNEHYKDIDGVLFDKSGKTLIQYPEGNSNAKYIIPEGVTRLEDESLFSGGFYSIEMPDTVTEIGHEAFAHSRNLQEIRLSNKITEIQEGTFNGCTSLRSIVIPEGVTSIGDRVFYRCKKLKKVSLPSTLNELESDSFKGMADDTIFYVANEEIKEFVLNYSDISEDRIIVGKLTVDENIDKSALKSLYDLHKDLSQGKYTDETWNAFVKARDNAKDVLEFTYADQDDINKAYEGLKNAFEGLKQASSGSSSSGGSGGSGSGSGGSSSGGSGGSSSSGNTDSTVSGSTSSGSTNSNEITGNSGSWLNNNDGTWSFSDKDGQKVASQWVQDNGKWYYLNESGTMKTGWHQDSDGKWYNLNTSGEMNSGWLKDTNGKWYFLNQNGSMETGWVKDSNNKWYFLNNSGDMATGWVKDNGKWYFLNESGDMQSSGWKAVNGKWYYFYSNGEMASNTVINGYKVNADGEWV